jgi:hypothetical protein
MIKKFEKWVPQGWVNVKIDNQLDIRLGKYVAALDNLARINNKDINNLKYKLEILK